MPSITERLSTLPGRIGFYYKNLTTGEVIEYNPELPVVAASVIKLFVMVEAFRRFEEGSLSRDEVFTVNRKDCVPSCGALTYLHDGIRVTMIDLVTLMIILSDNSATNFLMDILGIDNINRTITEMGFTHTKVGRKMFDAERDALGIQNYICASETGRLLEMIWSGTAVSAGASEEMLKILSDQRLNGKIPFFLHSLEDGPDIAHKTGEDTGTTHDAAVVMAKQPFVLVFLSNDTDVPRYERLMQDVSLELYQAQSK